MFAGQVMVGAVWSATETVKLQFAELPAASVAVIVTVWLPRLSVVPLAGDCVLVGVPQLSEALAAPV